MCVFPSVGRDAEGEVRLSDASYVAEKYQWAVVYPEGINNVWNSPCCGNDGTVWLWWHSDFFTHLELSNASKRPLNLTTTVEREGGGILPSSRPMF